MALCTLGMSWFERELAVESFRVSLEDAERLLLVKYDYALSLLGLPRRLKQLLEQCQFLAFEDSYSEIFLKTVDNKAS